MKLCLYVQTHGGFIVGMFRNAAYQSYKQSSKRTKSDWTKNTLCDRKERIRKLTRVGTYASSGGGSEPCDKKQAVISPLFFLTKPAKIEMKAMTTNRRYALILLFIRNNNTIILSRYENEDPNQDYGCADYFQPCH